MKVSIEGSCLLIVRESIIGKCLFTRGVHKGRVLGIHLIRRDVC